MKKLERLAFMQRLGRLVNHYIFWGMLKEHAS